MVAMPKRPHGQVFYFTSPPLPRLPLIKLVPHLVDGQQRADRQDEVSDELFGRLGVEQRTHDLGGLAGADLRVGGGGGGG